MGILQDWANKLGFGPGDHTNQHKAEDLLGQGIHAYDGITPPDLQPVNLQGESYVGDVTPGQSTYNPASVVAEGATNFNSVSTDPRLREAQMRALASMQGVADSGGMTAEDTANLSRIGGEAASADQARRNAILQNMQQRGMGGSGAELLAQLSSSQAATDRQAQQGLDVAGMAQSRALQAMMGAGQMGGALRGEDWQEQAAKAQAQDAIDQFNARASTMGNFDNAHSALQNNQFNVGLGYNAAVNNQHVKQGVSNDNTGISNQQTMYSAGLPQQNFGNKMAVAGGKSGASMAGVNYYGNQQSVKDQTQSNKQGAILGAAGQLGAAAIMGPAAPAAAAAAKKSDTGNHSGDYGDYSGYAWRGGRVPGHAAIPGNNLANDTFTAHLSPDEVVVPRTLAQHGSASDIGHFVKHAPAITPADKKREAMLSALKNLHRRGA